MGYMMILMMLLNFWFEFNEGKDWMIFLKEKIIIRFSFFVFEICVDISNE